MTAVAESQGTPRTRREVALSHAVVRLLCNAVAGVLVMLASYVGASGTPRVSTQRWWVALGIVGLVIAGGGSARFLLEQFQALRLAQAELLAPLLNGRASDSPRDATLVARVVLASEGVTRYHLSTCPLVQGKSVTERSIDALGAGALLPCGICQH